MSDLLIITIQISKFYQVIAIHGHIIGNDPCIIKLYMAIF